MVLLDPPKLHCRLTSKLHCEVSDAWVVHVTRPECIRFGYLQVLASRPVQLDRHVGRYDYV